MFSRFLFYLSGYISTYAITYKSSSRLLIAIGLLLPSFFTSAQSLSDLDEIRKRQQEIFFEREQKRLTPSPEVRLRSDEVVSGIDVIPENETPCFIIDTIALQDLGKKNDERSYFQWALRETLFPKRFLGRAQKSPLLGKCLGSQGINIVMRRVQNAIIQRGYVTTRVVAGPQELNSGVLKLTVVPGRIRSIKTERNKFLLPLKEGDLLNLRDIEQALENLKSLPSVQTDIQIRPAEGKDVLPGESDLVILWQQDRAWRLGLSIDDSGAATTGEHQASMIFSVDDLANLNDSLSLSFTTNVDSSSPDGGESEAYSFRYSFPFGSWGLALSVSENDYLRPVEGAFTTSDYEGLSKNYQLEVSRLLYRDSRRKSSVSLSFWNKRSSNAIEGVEIQNQKRRNEGATLRFDYRQFLGSAVFNGALSYRKILDADDAALLLVSESDNPTPAIINTDLSVDIPLTLAGAPFRYFGQVRHQHNLDEISSQDYFTIGNRYNVRTGNESSSLSAERGWYLRNDLEMLVGAPWAILYVGLDHGRLSGDSFRPESDELTAKVFGIKGRIKKFSYDLSVMSAQDAPAGFQDATDNLQFSLNWQF